MSRVAEGGRGRRKGWERGEGRGERGEGMWNSHDGTLAGRSTLGCSSSRSTRCPPPETCYSQMDPRTCPHGATMPPPPKPPRTQRLVDMKQQPCAQEKQTPCRYSLGVGVTRHEVVTDEYLLRRSRVSWRCVWCTYRNWWSHSTAETYTPLPCIWSSNQSPSYLRVHRCVYPMSTVN